jgi:hypothetical protein
MSAPAAFCMNSIRVMKGASWRAASVADVEVKPAPQGRQCVGMDLLRLPANAGPSLQEAAAIPEAESIYVDRAQFTRGHLSRPL